MKKLWIFINIFFLFPFSVFAYSNKVIVGGETIGIEVFSKGVYVVGFYPVFGNEIAKEAGFQKGDIIIKIDGIPVESIANLNQIITDEKEYIFTVERDNKQKEISLSLQEENSLLKTGLYVKDQINGIGTLSYIDPNTKIYGSLGHEILESTSLKKFEISGGTIYKAEVSSIKKSQNGLAGSKNASMMREEEYGDVSLNEVEGIFGKYTTELLEDDLMEVGTRQEIRNGEATIRTVISENKIEEFDIHILAIDEASLTKNILFEITDEKLLQKTGGIVQGMSGSPIIQNNKIIGVVNYVIVEDTKKGYGIFITTMLEKGDEILS